MPILAAYFLPHPPLAIPDIGHNRLNDIPGTIAAYEKAAVEIAALSPETIVFITPHNTVYSDYFHISPGNGAKGSFARFGAPDVCLETEYDAGLADEIACLAGQAGLRAGPLGEKDAALDHGVMVPMWYINHRFRQYKTVRISQSGMDSLAHYRLGRCVAESGGGRKTVLIASGDLSHKLSAEGPYGFAPEGAEFDALVTQALSSGDFLSLLTIPESIREGAGECGYNAAAVLAGCFDRMGVNAKLMCYEGPFGVGYAAASFTPAGPDASHNFGDRFSESLLVDTQKRQSSEDCYRSLARQSLEYTVRHSGALPLPDHLPDELLHTKAGVFVSLHKNGRLRGCIGTIAPTAKNVACEIIQNAVSAGLRDTRFDPVEASELPYLTYKVDVLAAPEPVSGLEDLDVKRYGVIVTSGYKRGLLLPNLDGIDTVEEQVAVARKKGGIAGHEPVQLERFEVVRHE